MSGSKDQPVRVYAFGDTGGHGIQLFESLTEIGVDLSTYSIPPAVLIVSLGDLIHKGPDSNELALTVDRLIERNPGQWLQVLGNHEFQHLQGGRFMRPCDCSPETIAILERWYSEGIARMAWALEDVAPRLWTRSEELPGRGGPVSSLLLTHAGLTRPIWESLGRPATATEAAAAIHANRLRYTKSIGEAIQLDLAGAVGPLWASAAGETFRFWELEHSRTGEPMPFGQLIGHNAPYDFSRGSWWPNVHQSFRDSAEVLLEERRTVALLAESVIVCLDPSYGDELDFSADPRQPYLSFELSSATRLLES